MLDNNIQQIPRLHIILIIYHSRLIPVVYLPSFLFFLVAWREVHSPSLPQLLIEVHCSEAYISIQQRRSSSGAIATLIEGGGSELFASEHLQYA
jgi:hypothetical protein